MHIFNGYLHLYQSNMFWPILVKGRPQQFSRAMVQGLEISNDNMYNTNNSTIEMPCDIASLISNVTKL